MKADYDLISVEWSNARQALPSKDHELFESFVNRLPLNARLLDMGCGSGVPIAQQLSEKGFSVVGIDRSRRLLEKARSSVPSGIFLRAEIEDYAIEGMYDGVVLWDSIFHIPRQEHRGILEKIHHALEPQGLLLLSSGGSEEELPSFTDFMFGIEFYYDAFTPNKLLNLCKNIGFTVENCTLLNEPDGIRDKGRIGAVLSKP